MPSSAVTPRSASRGVEARLVELSRALPPAVKLRQLGELVEALERLAGADIRVATPGLNARQTQLALAERRYGIAWVRERIPSPAGSGRSGA